MNCSVCPSCVHSHCISVAFCCHHSPAWTPPPPNLALVFTLTDQVPRPLPCLGSQAFCPRCLISTSMLCLSKNMFSPALHVASRRFFTGNCSNRQRQPPMPLDSLSSARPLTIKVNNQLCMVYLNSLRAWLFNTSQNASINVGHSHTAPIPHLHVLCRLESDLGKPKLGAS